MGQKVIHSPSRLWALDNTKKIQQKVKLFKRKKVFTKLSTHETLSPNVLYASTSQDTPAQLMRPGIGRNASCTPGDSLLYCTCAYLLIMFLRMMMRPTSFLISGLLVGTCARKWRAYNTQRTTTTVNKNNNKYKQ